VPEWAAALATLQDEVGYNTNQTLLKYNESNSC